MDWARMSHAFICWPLPKMLANYFACNNSWVSEQPVAIHICVFLLNRKCKVKKDEAEVLAPLYDYVAVLPHIQAWRMHWRLWVGLIWSCGGSEWNFLWVYGLGWGLFVPKHFSPSPILFIHSFYQPRNNIITNVYILCCFHSVLHILRWRLVIIGEKMFHLFVLKLYPSNVRLRTTGELWSVWFSTCIYSSALMSSWIYIYIKPTHGVNNVTNWLCGNNTALSYRWKDGDNQR